MGVNVFQHPNPISAGGPAPVSCRTFYTARDSNKGLKKQTGHPPNPTCMPFKRETHQEKPSMPRGVHVQKGPFFQHGPNPRALGTGPCRGKLRPLCGTFHMLSKNNKKMAALPAQEIQLGQIKPNQNAHRKVYEHSGL